MARHTWTIGGHCSCTNFLFRICSVIASCGLELPAHLFKYLLLNAAETYIRVQLYVPCQLHTISDGTLPLFTSNFCRADHDPGPHSNGTVRFGRHTTNVKVHAANNSYFIHISIIYYHIHKCDSHEPICLFVFCFLALFFLPTVRSQKRFCFAIFSKCTRTNTSSLYQFIVVVVVVLVEPTSNHCPFVSFCCVYKSRETR